jgi:hypothetical protein
MTGVYAIRSDEPANVPALDEGWMARPTLSNRTTR